MTHLAQKSWWPFLTPDQQANLLQSFTLLSEEKHRRPDRFQDYSFIVFPAAKAYEGFLKKLFLSLNLITAQEYNGEHFRIGKSLNPSLKHDSHETHVYDQLARLCQGEALPRQLWDAWKQSRNLLFHWFPQQQNFVTLNEAENRLHLIIQAIDESFAQCQLAKTV